MKPDYAKQLLDGHYNQRPEWRDGAELERALVQKIGCVKLELPAELNKHMWIIYSKQAAEGPLIVASYEWNVNNWNWSTRQVEHIFANNPKRTENASLDDLVADAELTARAVSESGLYPMGRRDAGATLRDLVVGMLTGSAAGFAVGAGVIGALSHYAGISIPEHFSLLGAAAGGFPLGLYMSEGPEMRRVAHAAEHAINSMESHPATYLHGPPAISIIEKYVEQSARIVN